MNIPLILLSEIFLWSFNINPFTIPVTITAYTAHIQQTDATPLLTASQKHVRKGYIAVSRDLEKGLGLKFGDFLYVNGIKYEFQDRMNKKWKKRVDIFMWSRKEAVKFGKQYGLLEIRE